MSDLIETPDLNPQQKVGVLIDAMPWIEQFKGAVIVISDIQDDKGREVAAAARFDCRRRRDRNHRLSASHP